MLWQPSELAFQPVVTVQPLFWGIIPEYSFGILAEEAIARLLSDNIVTVILEVDADLESRVPFFLRGLITCVTVTKAMLGVHAWWIWTPRQLYKYLLRHGARLWHRHYLDEGCTDGRSTLEDHRSANR